jgi:hypothetical protein
MGFAEERVHRLDVDVTLGDGHGIIRGNYQFRKADEGNYEDDNTPRDKIFTVVAFAHLRE